MRLSRIPEGTTKEILADLIEFLTVSRDPNRQLINYCAELLGDVGVDSHIIENDEGTKANLLATIGPADWPGVMLTGNTDVVPIDGQAWTRPAFAATEEDGRIYGRGYGRGMASGGDGAEDAASSGAVL